MGDDIQVLITIISLISAILGLIAAIAGRKQIIEIKNVQDIPVKQKESSPQIDIVTSYSSGNLSWYDKTIWLVVAFVFFWPIGLYGLYKTRAVSTGWKVGVFITFIVLAFMGAISEL